jgi:hypothetical protein
MVTIVKKVLSQLPLSQINLHLLILYLVVMLISKVAVVTTIPKAIFTIATTATEEPITATVTVIAIKQHEWLWLQVSRR